MGTCLRFRCGAWNIRSIRAAKLSGRQAGAAKLRRSRVAASLHPPTSSSGLMLGVGGDADELATLSTLDGLGMAPVGENWERVGHLPNP